MKRKRDDTLDMFEDSPPEQVEIPGMDEPTLEDANKFLLRATRQPIPLTALKAAEMVLKLNGLGGYGRQVIEVHGNPLEELLDEINATVPKGGLSDLVKH